ncbi:hypothetical protein EYF80_022606 [Liparis tanakae]|uniref:Uncharacterized protein n=1 Tax=Liparis tanakae TaxID=230148 RepID=A0A4Z2HMU5_9TELE|nr:hypothetical protein EYF80_022606 [Liparis tanakae]
MAAQGPSARPYVCEAPTLNMYWVYGDRPATWWEKVAVAFSSSLESEFMETHIETHHVNMCCRQTDSTDMHEYPIEEQLLLASPIYNVLT